MPCFTRSWVTAALTVCSIASILPVTYSNPLAAGKHSTSEGDQIKSHCLYNQYYDVINQVCDNCSYCLPGTQHSSQETCGYGEGVKTTCEPCAENQFQPHEGYRILKCSSCVTCDPNADILQNCSSTENAKCGPCHAGYYEFSPNVCFNCTEHPDHQDCKRTTTPATSPTDQPPSLTNPPSTPATALPPSSKTADHPSSSPEDIKETTTEQIGSQTTKVSPIGLGLGAFIVVILICIALYVFIQRRKWTGASGTSKPAQDHVTYNEVPTISKDQPSTSTASTSTAEVASIVCVTSNRISRQSSQDPDRQQLLVTGDPAVPQPSFSPSDVTNDYISGPHSLSINGGDVYHEPGMYLQGGQGQFDYNGERMSAEREPGSPDSARDNFSFQDDEYQNDRSAEPRELRA